MKKGAATLFILLLTWVGHRTMAQCSTSIFDYPYSEDFEAGNGNWTAGGTASSWQWGVINKPVISTAGTGQRGWATGGLTGAFYNDGENSWLRSPCFDFSSLQDPMISFKIFWETERQYDGASIEYSTNGGNTWTILGSENSNANCDGENWFNFSPVRYLGNEPGWSGNIQSSSGSCVGGGGSGGWVTAKHKLSFLAGATNVRFRFRFGAGTSCNQYDGLAIDDIKIEDVPASTASYTSQCAGFTATYYTVIKVCQTGVLWNFGDPASGAANTSTSFNPTHVFSGPGPYTITMTATYRGSPSATAIQQITIVDPVASVTSPVRCNGGTANATVTVNPPGTYNYTWNTTPLQHTKDLTNVPAGNYNVVVYGANICQATASLTIPEPPLLTVSLTRTPADCSTGRGSLTSSVTGGTAPYSYLWSDGSTASSLNNQLPGNYTLTVRDANGCTQVRSETILAPANNIQIVPSITSASCGAANGAIAITVSGGSAPYSYQWSNGALTQGISNIPAGNYSVIVRDAAGCSITSPTFAVSSSNVSINIAPAVTPARCNGSNGAISLTPTGGTAPYSFSWNNGAIGSTISNLPVGTYSAIITDINGCSANTGDIIVTNENPAIIVSPHVLPEKCSNSNGSVSLSISGGTAPYTYSWSNGETGSSISNLAAGSYSVTVTDRNGCVSPASTIVVANENASIIITPTVQPAQCTGNNGIIDLAVSGGNAPYQFAWSNGSSSQNISSLATGSYSVEVRDAAGCTASLTGITVSRNTNSLNVFLGPDRNYCPGMTVRLSPGNQFSSYSWQDGSNESFFSITAAGVYSVRVTDMAGCIGMDTVTIYSNCNDLYFPSAFTPNGDARNETFGPLGDFTGLRNFELIVYGRWGQEVFRSTDPSKKWDGTYKGKLQGMQSFVFTAKYTIGNRLPQVVKGSVTLVQ